MIVQDNQTGALHEVPDQLSGYGDYGETVYDGLGNPVGRLAGIFDDIGRAVGSAVRGIPGVGPVLSNFPVLSNLLPGGAAGPPMPPMPFPGLPAPSMPMPGFPMAPGFPSFRPSWP